MSADALVVANYLRVASQDLDGARILAANNNRNAVYLCEQAAEKVMRAILTSEGKHAGIRHKLDEMVDLVPDENPLKPMLRTVEHLAAYATTYRYPTEVGRIKAAPPAADLAKDLANVEAVLNEACARFKVDPLTTTPAGSTAPIR
jgi:HEPN domain-containing protein